MRRCENVQKKKAPHITAFNYDLPYARLNLRERPELYKVGKGEQGVLLVEPYKSEILPYWRFRTPEIAVESTKRILGLFEEYKRAGDFVGMDMARKFIQMGYTRARRYANHRSGRKYAQSGNERPRDPDPAKAAAAAVFKRVLEKLRSDRVYRAKAAEWKTRYG
jgi:hypothetical protein